MMMKPVKQFRQAAGLPVKFIKPSLPSLYGISEYFLPKPKDYPANGYFTGFWTSPSAKELDTALMDFIREGEPPLLITFGSMTFETSMDLPTAINRLAEELNVIIIIVKGWRFNETQKLEKNPAVKVIASAPYDKLFPHVKAVIHHGGIGTITGRKTVFYLPVLYPLGDQNFWGMIAYKKQIALKPIALKKMTEDLLLAKVKELLLAKELYVNSTKLSEKIKSENGVEQAVELIEKNYR